MALESTKQSPDGLLPTPTADGIDATQVDRSCRWPLLWMAGCGLGWLSLASLLQLLASLKFHNPQFLSGSAWLTYGRIQPAAEHFFAYGFAIPVSVAVGIWVMARLGRCTLSQPGVLFLGSLGWQAGVLFGGVGIFAEGPNGFPYLEMPLASACVLFASFLVIGSTALAVFHHRQRPDLYVAQWLLLAALVWFAWVFSSAVLLLLGFPTRGAMQGVVQLWYAHNLNYVVLPLFALGLLHYFVPKLAGVALHSQEMALFGFWTFVLFAGFGGVTHGTPVPSWLPALSTTSAMLSSVGVLALALNLWRTFPKRRDAASDHAADLRWLKVALAAYGLFFVLTLASSFASISRITTYTYCGVATQRLAQYGFVGLVLLVAVFQLLPALLATRPKWYEKRRSLLGAWAVGALLLALPLLAGGIRQGFLLNGSEADFTLTTRAVLMALRVGTLGDLLLALAPLGTSLVVLGMVIASDIWRCSCCSRRESKPQLKEVTA